MKSRFAGTTARMAKWRRAAAVFLVPAESDVWLSYLRVGLGLQTACYCLSLRADWSDLFGDATSRTLAEKILSLESSLVPRLGWSAALAQQLGLTDDLMLWLVWSLLLCGACALLIGVFPRFFAALIWFIHLSASKSAVFSSYGVDNFMTIGLFYLMLAPLPDRFCLGALWPRFHLQDRQSSLGDAADSRSHLPGFWRRVFQLHLCIIYFFGGLTKSLGSGWWDGSSLWRALIRPPFNVVAPEILVRGKLLFPVMGVAIVLLEISYPIFIWQKRTRPVWLVAICTMHIAIGLTMGMYLFALVMIVLNVAAFGPEIRIDNVRQRMAQLRPVVSPS